MFRSPSVVRVSLSLARVLPGLSPSWLEQQFPEDGRIEGTKDCLVEVDDSPEGRPQLNKLSTQQPEGSRQLWTPFSRAAPQRGLKETLYPFSCVRERRREGETSALCSSTHPSLNRDDLNSAAVQCIILMLAQRVTQSK